MPQVTIIDGGGANIASLQFALQRLGATSELTVDPARIRAAERIILPGVGAAADAMHTARTGRADRIDSATDAAFPRESASACSCCTNPPPKQIRVASESSKATCSASEKAPERPVPHMGWNSLDKAA